MTELKRPDPNDNDLVGEFDAMVWAERFVERVNVNPSIATDAGTMVAWFAGAIMAGHDHARKKYDPEPGPDAHSVEFDRHEWFVEVGEYSPTLSVVCRYDKTDETRPCWPWDNDRDVPEKLTAPQDQCTYESWVENLLMDELVHDSRVLPLGPVDVSWENDSMEVHL